MQTVIVHINNEDPIVCEMDELPTETSLLVILNNPRRRDGSDVHYLDEGVATVLYPMHRINFIQVLPSAEMEEVIGFVRE